MSRNISYIGAPTGKRVHLTEIERNYGEGDIFAMVVLV